MHLEYKIKRTQYPARVTIKTLLNICVVITLHDLFDAVNTLLIGSIGMTWNNEKINN